MEKKQKAFNKKKMLLVLLFLLMVAVQLGRIIYVFTQREGFHSDEAWSYGFANSYYDPYIYQDVNEDIYLSDATTKNMNEWLPGSVFWDYLVVNEGEEFSYGSVYYNQRGDMSPPLHTMILHTICSFFPETFSWWYAFSINIVMFVLIQIVFYALVKTVTGKDWMAFLLCGYYGFSYGAVSTIVYLRQYALLTFLTLLLLYLLARMFRKDFKKVGKECVLSILVTALGGLTHYYFYVFACILAGLTCFYLLFRKRWKALAAYALSMLAGAVLGILAYPYCLGSMFQGVHTYDHGLHYPYYWNLTTCLTLVLNETMGFGWGVDRMTFAWLSVLIPSLAVILFAVWFLCRKEEWMIRFLSRIRQWLKNWKANCSRVIRGWNPFLIFCFGAAVITIMIIAKVSSVETMGILTDRYLFYVMPVMLMTLCLFVFYLARRYIPGKKIRIGVCAVIVLGCMLLNQTRSSCTYLEFISGIDEPLCELTEDSDVILTGAYGWRMEWYSYELRNVHSFFMTEGEDCINYTDQLNDYTPEEGRDVYLILEDVLCEAEDDDAENGQKLYGTGDIDVFYRNSGVIGRQEYLDYLEQEIDWVDQVEYMYERNSFCGKIYLYKIHVKGV